MSTLTATFQPMLPFSVITSSLPSPNSIYPYTISLSAQRLDSTDDHCAEHGLLFFNQKAIVEVVGEDLPRFMSDWRALFTDGLVGATTSTEERYLTPLRESGLVLCSAFEFEPRMEPATVWLREDFADRIVGDEAWRVCILKTDVWRVATMAVKSRESMRKGVRGGV